jgi:hypothetical protein
MEKVKIEDYLPAVNQISGVELSEKDNLALTALFRERHFKKIDPIPDGLFSFLKIIRMVHANPWPEGSNRTSRKRSSAAFPKALKPWEKGKRQYLADCTRGFIEYLKILGLAENDSRHLAGRTIALVYEDWNPRYKDGTTKGLGGERNFILRRVKHLLGEVKQPAN